MPRRSCSPSARSRSAIRRWDRSIQSQSKFAKICGPIDRAAMRDLKFRSSDVTEFEAGSGLEKCAVDIERQPGEISTWMRVY